MAGGLEAVQTASILAAFPFLVVLVAAAVALVKDLHADTEPVDPYAGSKADSRAVAASSSTADSEPLSTVGSQPGLSTTSTGGPAA